MIKFLKYINSIPFPFTMKHYQVFGDSSCRMRDGALDSLESWDVLRKEHPHFSVSQNREEWLMASESKVKKDGQDELFPKRAEQIVEILKRDKISRIFSVGVGGAGLEYQIKKRLPGIKLVCSEYSDLNVSVLRKVFLESDEVVKFDVLRDSWMEVNKNYLGPNSLCLIYRIDASFSDKEWSEIFSKIARAGISRVLFIPTGVLTVLSIWNRKRRELKWFFKQTPVLFSGFIRTKKRFQSYWNSFYDEDELSLSGLRGFLLNLKK